MLSLGGGGDSSNATTGFLIAILVGYHSHLTSDDDVRARNYPRTSRADDCWLSILTSFSFSNRLDPPMFSRAVPDSSNPSPTHGFPFCAHLGRARNRTWITSSKGPNDPPHKICTSSFVDHVVKPKDGVEVTLKQTYCTTSGGRQSFPSVPAGNRRIGSQVGIHNKG